MGDLIVNSEPVGVFGPGGRRVSPQPIGGKWPELWQSPDVSLVTAKADAAGNTMIRKLKSGQYRLYSRKKNPRTGKRRNLGTFASRAAAEKHERAVQFFKGGGRGK